MNDALERQVGQGGRLGDHLVAAGYISEKQLEAFLNKFPVEPESIEATGLDETELLALLMKQIYSFRIQSTREYSDTIKLPAHIIAKLVRTAVERKLLYAKGVRPDNTTVMTYDLTDEGRRWAMDALNPLAIHRSRTRDAGSNSTSA